MRFITILSLICIVILNASVSWGRWEEETFGKSIQFNDIYVDNEYIWGATSDGVIKWNKVTGEYISSSVDVLKHTAVAAIAVDKNGIMWFGESRRLYRYDGKTSEWYDVPENNYSRTIGIDYDGSIWVGGIEGNIFRFDGKSWKKYGAADGLIGKYINCMAFRNDGTKWFGTDGGLLRFDGSSWKTYTTADGLPGNNVTSIAIGKDDEIWVGTGKGVSRFDGQSWKSYTRADGLTENNITCIAVDIDGSIWVGGSYYGVSRFDGQSWKAYTKVGGIVQKGTKCIDITSDGAKWFGTANGVSRFDGESWKEYITKDGLAGFYVNRINIDREGIKWFDLTDGFIRYDGHSWTTFSKAGAWELYGKEIFIGYMSIDREGTKWFNGSSYGVFRFDGKTWTNFTTNDGLADNNVWNISFGDDGTVWFLTKNGLTRFDGNSWKTFTKNDGLAGNEVGCFAIDKDGSLWVATWYGVSHFDGKSWRTYTMNDGLAQDAVTDMAIDKDGVKWFGTFNHGITRFDGTSWKTFTDTFLLDVKNILVGPDGTAWITTDYGIYRFDGQYFRKVLGYDTAYFVMDVDSSFWFNDWIDSSTPGIFHLSYTERPQSVESIPSSFQLRQNFPNPFNPSTTIFFTLSRSGQTRVSIYNSQGQKIRTLMDGPLAAGSHTMVWNGRDAAGKAVASGIYFSELVSPGGVERKKMLLMR